MRAEVLTGKERRRLWRYEDKVHILEETVSSGMTIADVARRNDVGESPGSDGAPSRVDTAVEDGTRRIGGMAVAHDPTLSGA